ncbi:hypothetical protein KCP75_16500 [Salmonella enterica subsp. enterica]|nr:hypothetical protein KCP75_16500 [Salmonella enterica subsp. enterica]
MTERPLASAAGCLGFTVLISEALLITATLWVAIHLLIGKIRVGYTSALSFAYDYFRC